MFISEVDLVQYSSLSDSEYFLDSRLVSSALVSLSASMTWWPVLTGDLSRTSGPPP